MAKAKKKTKKAVKRRDVVGAAVGSMRALTGEERTPLAKARPKKRKPKPKA